MEDFIKRQGPAFLAHLLRRLSDAFVRGLGEWLPEAGVKAPPRTTSTMLALAELGPLGVTEIAAEIRQSHPHIITWVRQLKELGFVESEIDPADGRRTLLSLTEAGKAEAEALRETMATIARTYDRLMSEADAHVFDALWRLEEACRRSPFSERLRKEAEHERMSA